MKVKTKQTKASPSAKATTKATSKVTATAKAMTKTITKRMAKTITKTIVISMTWYSVRCAFILHVSIIYLFFFTFYVDINAVYVLAYL